MRYLLLAIALAGCGILSPPECKTQTIQVLYDSPGAKASLAHVVNLMDQGWSCTPTYHYGLNRPIAATYTCEIC